MKQKVKVGEKVQMVRSALKRGVPPGILRKNPWGLAAATAVAAGVREDEQLISIIKILVGSFSEERFEQFFSGEFQPTVVKFAFDD